MDNHNLVPMINILSFLLDCSLEVYVAMMMFMEKWTFLGPSCWDNRLVDKAGEPANVARLKPTKCLLHMARRRFNPRT
jgi:hypothetical protein